MFNTLNYFQDSPTKDGSMHFSSFKVNLLLTQQRSENMSYISKE